MKIIDPSGWTDTAADMRRAGRGWELTPQDQRHELSDEQRDALARGRRHRTMKRQGRRVTQ